MQLPVLDHHILAVYILLLGFMWLLLKVQNPGERACPDCGMPGGKISGGDHWPDCKRGKYDERGRRIDGR